jgi:hypothetical protein
MRPDTTSAIRARLIAAIEQRAAALDGQAQRALAVRLSGLRSLDATAPNEAPGANALPPQPSPLRELLDHLAGDASPDRDAYPDVPALADFRRLWSVLRADSQLQQSTAQAPTDAGPLNSTALVSRAVALMRELSPSYLRSFLAYVDDLAWLEQTASTGPATGSAAPRKRAPPKPRAK